MILIVKKFEKIKINLLNSYRSCISNQMLSGQANEEFAGHLLSSALIGIFKKFSSHFGQVNTHFLERLNEFNTAIM